MAKYGAKAKEEVKEAMHEFKHGELKSATGGKVTNPKQAVAIGLSEAGASYQQSPAVGSAGARTPGKGRVPARTAGSGPPRSRRGTRHARKNQA